MDSNHRPPGYEPDALTNWAKGPELPLPFNSNIFFILVQEIFAFLHEKKFNSYYYRGGKDVQS